MAIVDRFNINGKVSLLIETNGVVTTTGRGASMKYGGYNNEN